MRSAKTQRPRAQSADFVAQTDARLACAACVRQLADVEFRLLPESDAAVVNEHLSECPDCRLFNEQLGTTRELLAGTPPPDLPDSLERAQAELADDDIEHTLKGLYRVATALDVEDADELVQETLTVAISKGDTLNSAELIDALIRNANGTRSETPASLNDTLDAGASAYDPDSDTAELYYPEFYEQGPDVGRFVDSPNVWGHVHHVVPEDEVAYIELLEVADSAVNELPDVEMRVITLVDIESVVFDDAATALRVPKPRAARALNDARIHVRGAIDRYLSMREGAIACPRCDERRPALRE